jgi:hypothetical protein
VNALKTSVGCLFIALALNAAFTYGQSLWLAPYPAIPMVKQPVQSDTVWLQLNSHSNSRDMKLTPEHTVIVTSKQPTIKQIRKNCWQISFAH